MVKMAKNMGTTDRLLRVLVAVLSAEAAYFWVGGVWAYALYLLAGLMAATAAFGFCLLYVPLRLNTVRPASRTRTALAAVIAFAILSALTAGAYYSAFFTRKFFLEDFNRMNQPYKQTLFETGQGLRAEANADYDRLVAEHRAFMDKYRTYRPYALRGDSQFAADMERVEGIIAAVEPGIRSGNLAQTHKDLEGIRPIYQEMLKRNGFSMLAVYLVDFHDAMEGVLDAAAAKDAARVQSAYAEADARLKTVEETANDAEIQAIRAALDDVLSAAKDGQTDVLPDLGAKLKAKFVKVYLQRG